MVGDGGGMGSLWSLVLIVFPILTFFGNVLVILSVYKERSLRSATNYFIVNLAIADLLVAAFVMPLALVSKTFNRIYIIFLFLNIQTMIFSLNEKVLFYFPGLAF